MVLSAIKPIRITKFLYREGHTIYIHVVGEIHIKTNCRQVNSYVVASHLFKSHFQKSTFECKTFFLMLWPYK